MNKKIIHTAHAPAAIGTYSQAVRCGNTVYLSGQIPLDPETMELCSENISKQIETVITNLEQVCIAAGSTLANIVKLTIYLVDLSHFSAVNTVMQQFFTAPYPARAVIGVAALPRNAQVEMDAILIVD